ncbi:MAG: DUF1501 domain-containing protein [Gemmataceae bacterium]
MTILAIFVAVGSAFGADGPPTVTIANPQRLSADPIPVERAPLGEADDYKPCIAQLPSGELLLTAFHQHKRDGNKVMEQTLLFRSKDGGKSWSKAEKLDLLGREPYLTVLKDGTIFITGHLLANDVRNKWGYTCGFLHRSTDGGKSWESIRVESEGIKPKASNHTTRNVLQLADGTLLLGVDYDGGDGPYLMWRSKDNGKTWDRTGKCQPKNFKSKYGFFGGETWLWQTKSGKIWALVRVDSVELPIKDRPIQAKNDQADHFILFSSKDEGKSFDRVRDFGDYGEMYMSLLRLQDTRLLLTFTVRDLKPPLGVRAIVGRETDDGFEFDFAKDRVMLDTRTPVGKYQGGGFGPTVQLKDGTLVTSYSYRGGDDKTHLEVVRWKLPAAKVVPVTGHDINHPNPLPGPGNTGSWDTHEAAFRHLKAFLFPPTDREVSAVFDDVLIVMADTSPNTNGKWDTHGDLAKPLANHLRESDQGLSALLDDLSGRGLLDTTVVAWMGEFGRTPKLNTRTNGGRDHWPHCYSVLLAGGGIRGGRVVGSSDALGAFPRDGRVHPSDILATIYHLLGVPLETELLDPLGRPHRLCSGKPIAALL